RAVLADRQRAPEAGAFCAQVALFVGALLELAERETRELRIAHRDVEAVAERAQVLLRDLLLLVRHHLTFAALAEAISLHGLGEDDRGLTFMTHGRGVGGVN